MVKYLCFPATEADDIELIYCWRQLRRRQSAQLALLHKRGNVARLAAVRRSNTVLSYLNTEQQVDTKIKQLDEAQQASTPAPQTAQNYNQKQFYRASAQYSDIDVAILSVCHTPVL